MVSGPEPVLLGANHQAQERAGTGILSHDSAGGGHLPPRGSRLSAASAALLPAAPDRPAARSLRPPTLTSARWSPPRGNDTPDPIADRSLGFH